MKRILQFSTNIFRSQMKPIPSVLENYLLVFQRESCMVLKMWNLLGKRIKSDFLKGGIALVVSHFHVIIGQRKNGIEKFSVLIQVQSGFSERMNLMLKSVRDAMILVGVQTCPYCLSLSKRFWNQLRKRSKSKDSAMIVKLTSQISRAITLYAGIVGSRNSKVLKRRVNLTRTHLKVHQHGSENNKQQDCEN